MSVTVEQGIPTILTKGDDVSFTVDDQNYPSSDWDATLVFKGPSGGITAFVESEPHSGTFHLFEITDEGSATLEAGRNLVCVSFMDADEHRKVGDWQQVVILADPVAVQVPSFAQAQVTLLKTVIAQFNTSGATTVNFNGQSFTRESVKMYQDQLTQWEAKVYQEQEQAKADRGIATIGNRIPVRFVCR